MALEDKHEANKRIAIAAILMAVIAAFRTWIEWPQIRDGQIGNLWVTWLFVIVGLGLIALAAWRTFRRLKPRAKSDFAAGPQE